MRRLRNTSNRRLALILTTVAMVALLGGIAQGALSGSGPVPSPKALANAIFDAVEAPEPEGITATIHLTNNLLPTGSLPGGKISPLVSGADGRLWIQKGGALRIELQSDAGDAQIVSDGEKVTVYDASSKTVYRGTLPAAAKDVTKPDDDDEKLTLAEIQTALERLAKTWTISDAKPTSVAGQPTYTVKISSKDDGGLLGAAELAWDAVRGKPLRAAVYAHGQAAPVLELKATAVSYGAVADSAVSVTPPADAKVVDLNPGSAKGALDKDDGGKDDDGKDDMKQSPADVQRELDFSLVAPAELAGLPRKEIRVVNLDGDKGALTIYGRGSGAIAVLQGKVKPAGVEEDKPDAEMDEEDTGALTLPKVNIDGATGSELATALGTVVRFERNGIAFTVAGSVPPVAAENAARSLR